MKASFKSHLKTDRDYGILCSFYKGVIVLKHISG